MTRQLHLENSGDELIRNLQHEVLSEIAPIRINPTSAGQQNGSWIEDQLD